MKNDSILKQRKEIEEEIKDLGYESLRYSLFIDEDRNREEWQWRIEYDNEKYWIYGLADRATILGRKIAFDDFGIAKQEFIDRLNYMVEVNLNKVNNGEKPYYSSPLWSI